MRAEAKDGTRFNQENLECEGKRAKGGMIGIMVWDIVWKKERSNINYIDGKRTREKNV